MKLTRNLCNYPGRKHGIALPVSGETLLISLLTNLTIAMIKCAPFKILECD